MKRILVGTIVILIVGIAWLSFLASYSKRAAHHAWFSPRPGEHKPLIMAHQGGEGEQPGNTMVAFQNAVNAGADVLDTDMHMTKDGVLVLIHDETVDRTTNGKGAVRDLTLSQLQQLDAAYSYSQDGKTFPYRGQGITIPTLEQLFNAFPDRRLGIEIKPTDPIGIAQQFCDSIRKHHLQNNVLVSSFNQSTMDAFRQACPEVATSATAYEAIKFVKLNSLGLTRTISPAYGCFQVPEKSGSTEVINPAFIAAARERHLPILPWTINDEQAFQRLVRYGVDAINTDYPTRMIRLLKTGGGTTKLQRSTKFTN